MPKMKTRRATAKRFRKTGAGKFKRGRAYRSHLMTHRTRKRKRQLRRNSVVSTAEQKRIQVLLPYA